MQTPLLLDAGKPLVGEFHGFSSGQFPLSDHRPVESCATRPADFGFLGLRKLKPPSRHTSEFSTRRSALAVAMVVLKRMFPQ